MSGSDPQTDTLRVPQKDSTDAILAAIRGATGIIPFAGSFVAEIVDWFFAPSIEQRRDAWMRDVVEVLQRLEQDFKRDVNELRHDSVFIDTCLWATQVAMMNTEGEKRAALRSALLNAGYAESPDAALNQMFLHWVGAFTSWHLRLLRLFDDPKATLAEQDAKRLDGSISCALSYVLETAFPALNGRREFYDQVWHELNAAGLVNTDSLHTMMTGTGTMQRRTSGLGRAFVSFVSEPIPGDDTR